MTDIVESEYLVDTLWIFPSYPDGTFSNYMDDTCSGGDRNLVVTEWLIHHKITLVWCEVH